MYTYLDLIKENEKKAQQAQMEVGAIKWLFFYADFSISYHQLREEANAEIVARFNDMVSSYINDKIPPQYILHKACFFGYDFYVDEHVFIPRPETEQLVEECLYRIDDFSISTTIRIADVCCGSGVIGITLKKEVENAEVTLCDISPEAIDIVKKNADLCEALVKTYVGDFIQPLLENKEKFHVLVCNPPYIKNKEKLDTMVVDHEPNIALFGGEDGLDFYRRIFLHAQELIYENGMMAFEFGYDQKEDLEKLLLQMLPEQKYEFLKDYAGLDRMLFLYF